MSTIQSGRKTSQRAEILQVCRTGTMVCYSVALWWPAKQYKIGRTGPATLPGHGTVLCVRACVRTIFECTVLRAGRARELLGLLSKSLCASIVADVSSRKQCRAIAVSARFDSRVHCKSSLDPWIHAPRNRRTAATNKRQMSRNDETPGMWSNTQQQCMGQHATRIFDNTCGAVDTLQYFGHADNACNGQPIV